MNREFKIVIFFALCFPAFSSTYAQKNLVPNWSFENITTCPFYTITNTLPLAPPWQNPSLGTPDIFSACDTAILFPQICPINGTPCNGAGIQPPRSGNNYAGIFPWALNGPQPDSREYCQVKLTDSLIKNNGYCVSFFVSLAERSSYVTSRMGALISNLAVSGPSWSPIIAVPQIANPFGNYINDSLNWTEIKGLYISSGGENYVTIGNFYDNLNTDTLFIGGRYPSGKDIYIYIDDVSLVEYRIAFAGNDTTICAGIKIKQNVISTFGAQYNWSVLNGDVNSIDSINIGSPNFSPTVTTTYILQKQQCGITSYDTLLVRVPVLYLAKIGTDTTICIGDTIILSAVNNCIWCNHLWNTGFNTTQISIQPSVNTSYQFYQTDSCQTTSDVLTVNVEYCKSPVITAPNIFTPNADGINDTWKPIILNELSILQYNLTIYDRWGLKIFEADKYNTGWDGHTTSRVECNEGTYYYVIEYTDIKTNENYTLKGFLQLSR